MEIKLEEVEHFGFVSMLMGIIVFIIACSWDNLLGITMNHHTGYGWFQMTVMAGSGLYSMWAYTINLKWREYQKKIHRLEEINVTASKR